MPTGGECTRRLQNKLITWDQEEGWNATIFSVTLQSLFLHFGIFLKTRSSATILVRHSGGTRTETVGLCNPELCLGHAWTVSTLATCSESLRNPQICSCGRRLLAHLEFPTSPPKIPLNSNGLSWDGQSQSRDSHGWSQQRKGGYRSQLSAGLACPQEIFEMPPPASGKAEGGWAHRSPGHVLCPEPGMSPAVMSA